jgi:DNA replication protein DnaC
MSNAACEAVIQEYCRELKLAAVVRDYPGLCRRARDGGWAYEDLLRELLEAEISNRHQSTARRLLREARFPDVKPSTSSIGRRSRACRGRRSWSFRAASSSAAPRT